MRPPASGCGAERFGGRGLPGLHEVEMKKRVFPRLALALFVSLAAFVMLSAMQFARYGTFSRQLGAMMISGRYYGGDAAQAAESRPGWTRLEGAASVLFAGLEFRLADAAGAGGFFIVDSGSERREAFPEYVRVSGHEAVFSLPHGVELSFESIIPEGSPGAMPELRISGAFPTGVSAIDLPFRPRRSSIAWDNSRGILGVTYDGQRHRFSRHSQELLDGRLVLLAGSPTVFYRAAPDGAPNSPRDFALPGMESAQAFSGALAAWTDRSFDQWGRGMPPDADEDRVIAFGAEALRRGVYGAAMSAVPAAFGTAPGRTLEPSVFHFERSAGVWERAARDSAAADRRKAALVGELLARRDYGSLFAKDRLVEFLATRGLNDLLDGLISSAWGIDPAIVTLRASAGILESYMDLGSRRPGADNPFEPLAARAMQLAADGLRQNGDQVLVFAQNGHADVELNLRLGRALREWGEQNGGADWAALGRTLLVSVMSLGNSFPGGAEGSVPAHIASGANGALTASAERIGSASLFRMLGESEFLPRAVPTGAAGEGIWAWTAARSLSIAQAANFMDIFVDFPAGQTHYVMLKGVSPFVLLQMHNQNTPRNQFFEEAGASGWDYFPEEQALVLKVQHRANVERIRVHFTVPAPAPAPAPAAPPPAPAPALVPAADPPLPPPPIRRPPTWAPPPVFEPGQLQFEG